MDLRSKDCEQSWNEEKNEMRVRKLWSLLAMLAILSLLVAACGQPQPTEPPPVEEEEMAEPTEAMEEEEMEEPTEEMAEEEPFTIGMLLVGPFNDRGWSQAHYDGGLYVEENVPGAVLIYIDKVNPADRPGTTGAQLAEDLLSEGADLIVFNSDDMKDDALEFARAHEDVPVIHISGDYSWEEGQAYQGQPNLANIMEKMIYGKMIAGCTAALTSKAGSIGYLGPLINDETRRLAASAYLGARYCWTEYAGNDAADLGFKVTWIGFWFNIPGFTADPTLVADDFFNSGFDVVISGIDTTEALIEADKFASEGEAVWAIPYDFIGSCEEAPDVCLGVPYFNWGPDYVEAVQAVKDGTFGESFEWNAPYWDDITDLDMSPVGFVKGDALGDDTATQVDAFIEELAGGLNLWVGPINLQDGTPYLADGEVATEQQIWYSPQLIEGMEGQSVAEE
jgi:simple sugar transport system substrate-binding protein